MYETYLYNKIRYIDDIRSLDFYGISLAFEYYTCLKLSQQYNKPFYHYTDILPSFKLENNLSKYDTGIDICDLQDSIVQVKLRSKNLSFKEVSTFLSSQLQYCNSTNKWVIKWQNPIIARNDTSTLSYQLKEQLGFNRFIDIQYNLEDFYQTCENLKLNPPNLITTPNLEIKLRDYQKEAIDIIKTTDDKNIYFCLPTGSGKTLIFLLSIKNNQKYLILVPLCILLEQTYEELLKIRPDLKDTIQLIGNGKNTFDENKNITICVYNSIELVGNLTNYYKVIIDEAHRILKPKIYEDIEMEKTSYTKIIKDHIDNYKNSILFSATLDKPNNTDDIYYQKTVRELIDSKILCDYQIVIPIFYDTANDKSICKYLVKNYSNIIVYCNSQQEGKEVDKYLNEYIPGCSCYVDCHTSRKLRREIIHKFKKGKIQFVVNVRILIEGFDAPICKGILMRHLTMNDKTFIQIIGRALRAYENKQIVNIILPFLNEQNTNELKRILRILSNNDYKMKEACTLQQKSGYINIEPVNIEENEDIDNEIEIDKKYELIFNSLGTCLQCNVLEWKENLNKLKLYLKKHNERPKLNSECEETQSLAYWIKRQRYNYKNSFYIMSNQIIRNKWEKFINEYGTYFPENFDIWLSALEKVKLYIQENNTLPKKTDENKNIKYLGKWIERQRELYKKKTKIFSSIEAVKIWEVFYDQNKELFLTSEEIWFERFNEIKEFIKINNEKPTDKSSIDWIAYSQRSFKDKNQCMSNPLIYETWKNFLEEYEIYFKEKDNEETWFQHLEELKLFIQKNKILPTRETNLKLTKWISSQQQNCKNQTKIMKNEKIQKTWNEFKQEFSYAFEHNNFYWNEQLDLVIKYIKEENKRPSETSKDEEVKRIAIWLTCQRTTYKKQEKIMADSEVRKIFEQFLEEYKEYFMSNEEKWYFNLEKVKKYIKEHKVRPAEKSTNEAVRKLGVWLSNNIINYRNNNKSMKNLELKEAFKNFKDEYKI